MQMKRRNREKNDFWVRSGSTLNRREKWEESELEVGKERVKGSQSTQA